MKRNRVLTFSLLLCLLLILVVLGYSRLPLFAWIGFGEYPVPGEGYEPSKTLWDWMQLLIVPVVLAAATIWFSQSRESIERKIEDRRVQEERIQAYLGSMTTLLLEHGLATSKPGDVVRHAAQAQTYATLDSIDGLRKGLVLRFLSDSLLIRSSGERRSPIISLKDTNLEHTVLAHKKIQGADMQFARLNGSDLREANLTGAQLNHVKLIGADLRKSTLRAANMRGANLANAQLQNAKLESANLMDAVLNGSHLTGARLEHACLRNAKLWDAELNDAHIENAYYSVETKWPVRFDPSKYPRLYKVAPGADLAGANLARADLGGADLSGANLEGADLSHAFLGGADLSRTNLEKTRLTGALYTDRSSPQMLPATQATVFPAGFNPVEAGMTLVLEHDQIPMGYRAD